MVEASDSGSRFRPDIQGLRAVAVSAVVLYHAGLPLLPGGYVGVDVFFVISGFLITSHLLSGLARRGRVSFAEFYARRARRILPASFVVLILSTIAALVWFPPVLMSQVWAGAVATALYVPNLLFAVQGTDYLADTAPSLFQHYWSLGVEEQFYLIWPALLALGWKAFRSKTMLKAVLALLGVASFGLGVWLTFISQPWAFFSLPTRAWELGLGAAIAFQLQHRSRLMPATVAPIVGWLGILAIVAASVLLSANTLFPRVLGCPSDAGDGGRHRCRSHTVTVGAHHGAVATADAVPGTDLLLAVSGALAGVGGSAGRRGFWEPTAVVGDPVHCGAVRSGRVVVVSIR